MAQNSESPHYNTELSQSESVVPLSPVLGSGQSVRKFRKRKRHKQDTNTNKNLEDTLQPQTPLKPVENQQGSKEECSSINTEPIPGPSSLQPLIPLRKPENILDRIKALEALEPQKLNIAKMLSVDSKVELGTLEDHTSIRIQPIDDVEYKTNTNTSEFIPKVIFDPPTGPVGFKTGTGKNIDLLNLDVNSCKKLFDDILCPYGSVTSRENKCNYLRKNFAPGSRQDVSQNFVDKSTQRHAIFNNIEGENEKVKMCENKNFDDLAFSNTNNGFKTPAIIQGNVKNDNTNLGLLKLSSNARKIVGKDLFDGENFDDLSTDNNTGSKRVSVNSSQEIIKQSDSEQDVKSTKSTFTKSVFEGEDFKDLPALGERVGFKSASAHLGGLNLSTGKCIQPRPNLSTGVFESGNFGDLNLKQITGFDNAPVEIAALKTDLNEETEGNFEKPADISKVLVKRTIFEGENFDDLSLKQIAGFDNAPVEIAALKTHLNEEKGDGFKKPGTSKIQARRTNVFEGENFDDLNLNFGRLKTLPNQAKRPSNIFKDENFDDINLKEIPGFKRASLGITSAQATTFQSKQKNNFKSENIDNLNRGRFKTAPRNIFEGEKFDDLNLKQIPGFSKASLSTNAAQTNTFPARRKNIFEGENFDDLNVNFGLLPKPLANQALKKPRNIFEGERFNDPSLTGLGPQKPNIFHNKRSSGFKTPYKTPVKTIVQDKEDFNGFSLDERLISLNISQDQSQIFHILDERFQLIVKSHNWEMPLFALKNIKSLSETLQRNLQKSCLNNGTRKRKFSEVDSDHNFLCQNAISSTTPQAKRSKRKLGCPFSPTIDVPKTGLKRAKLLFEDLEPKSIQTSTPIKLSDSLAKPLVCDLTPIPFLKKNSFLKANLSIHEKSSIDSTITGTNNRFSLNKPSEGGVGAWLDNLSHERRLLEERLRINDEKQTILTNQRTILDYSGRSRKRITPGVLYKSKNNLHKIGLREYVSYLSPGQSPCDNAFLNQINPQNAHLVHFYVCDKRESHVKTLDGAVIVPNTESRIGLSEIEHSFKLLDGVEPGLIPKGWIRNHYKWIVWKLASYERMFPDKFQWCLSPENVVQQLKYRYDVEIDNAKRPIIRKIFEKDECSQRKMVLCVSKIVKVNNSYELELTDGWYPIRTVIDPPLCDQIIKGKIKLGVKLIIYGAELINCEGCHPLEATDSVYLKINCNSTRRALWWCKLGCQKEAGPFLIPLSSINADGGKIGCIKCLVLRVYPVKYMEKCGDRNVWRNRKAEERREQECYNEKCKGVESNKIDFKSLKDISKINDPEILFDIMQTSDDPEALQEALTTSQRTILYHYSINKSGQKRYSRNCRTVTPTLKIKIVDFRLDSDKVYDFYIWRPGDGHLQELKEWEIVTIFNVSCSSKWGLSANQTTQFRIEAKPTDERFLKFRRNTTEISELRRFSKQKQLLNEFDTAGLIIKKIIDDNQQVWMADSKKKLLFIKINHSPKNVLALDLVSPGQLVSVSNLLFKRSFDTHSYAIGDHSVIFARYSQYKHLQDSLEKLEVEFMNVDRMGFMQDCENKIKQIECKWQPQNSLNLEMDGMECSQITITDMALLECVEKLT